MKVFIATSTFGDFSNESIDHLRQNELDVCLNKLGRKLTDNELIKFAENDNFRVNGLISSIEGLGIQLTVDDFENYLNIL